MIMQKRKPVRLKKIRDSARGQDCTIKSPWCLNGRDGNETVVFAHYAMKADQALGMKADDSSGAYACAQCHDWLDGRYKPAPGEYPWAEKEHYWFRGMRETWRMLLVNEVLK